MTWGIVINNNYTGRPQQCGQNNLFNMIMTYNMFQYFMNSLFNPQITQPMVQYPCCSPPMPSVFSMQNPYAQMNYNYYPQTNPFASLNTGLNLGSATYQNLIESDYFKELLKSEQTQSIYPDLDLSSEKKKKKKTNTSSEEEIPQKISKKGMFLKGKGKGTAYGPAFLAKVKEISKNIQCDYRDLLAIMNSESSIDATTVGHNGASGLICFMPQYFDVEKIRKMSPMEQLDLVEKTILQSKKERGFAGQKLSKEDLYALIFVPARAKQEVLATKGEKGKNGKLLRYYEGNVGLDKNGDNKITKSEMAARIDNKYVSDESFLA